MAMDHRGNTWEGGSAPAARELPVVSIGLIAVNTAVFLIGLLSPALGRIMELQGYFSALHLMYGRQYYRLITSAFLHVDVTHLFNNMLLLYFCGEIVEKTLGKCRFLILYLLSAVCGNLLSAAWELSTQNYYASVGASGAVFGLTGALLFLVTVKKGAAAHISMKRALIATALSVYAGFSDPGVNNAAHVGGLLSGFLLAFLLGILPRLPRRKRGFR